MILESLLKKTEPFPPSSPLNKLSETFQMSIELPSKATKAPPNPLLPLKVVSEIVKVPIEHPVSPIKTPPDCSHEPK